MRRIALNINVLDTNVILLQASNILTLGKYATIVIPETVVDELDAKKSGHSEIAYQARQFGRILAKAESHGTTTTDVATLTKFIIDDVEILIVSALQYPSFKDTEQAIRNDRKIIHIADILSTTYNTTFISNDVMCRIRAESLGLHTEDVKDVQDTTFEFTKELYVTDIVFSDLHNKQITSVDKDYKFQHRNYKFINTVTNQMKLATITTNGIIDIIGKTTEKELRKQDVAPINSDQLLLAQAIQDPLTDVIVCEALSGSGKTTCAISNAMKLVKTNTPYTSIIYIRASIDDVDDAEAVGFLSGNDEKFAVYSHPLHDTLDFIARNRNKNSKLHGKEYEERIQETIDDITDKYNIQFMTTLGMRGRTFRDSVIIIDELQNQSKASLQKTLTRFKDCKVILIGSNRQIDNKYLTKYTNGLSVVLDDCTKPNDYINAHVVPLHKVERSRIAEWSEKLFDKDSNK